MQVYRHIFERITSKENIFTAWEEFRKGKQGRKDVQDFERNLEQNLFRLHRELMAGTYRHQPYSAFTICDPKQRRIHKATVQDRILHHAVFSVLNPIFEPSFFARKRDDGLCGSSASVLVPAPGIGLFYSVGKLSKVRLSSVLPQVPLRVADAVFLL